LFKSAKLGFRNWQISDLTDFTSMNADPLVMRYFPSTLSAKKVFKAWKSRLRNTTKKVIVILQLTN
jgi:hypothetical protein